MCLACEHTLLMIQDSDSWSRNIVAGGQQGCVTCRTTEADMCGNESKGMPRLQLDAFRGKRGACLLMGR